MSTTSTNYGTRTQFSAESNLTSLGNNAAKPLGQVSNASELAVNYAFYLEMKLAAASVSADGTIEVYLLEKDDNSADKWTDGIDGDTTSDSASSLKNAKPLFTLDANANGQVVAFHGRLRDYVSDVPKYWSLLVLNKSGQALTGTGGDHDAYYTPIHGTIA